MKVLVVGTGPAGLLAAWGVVAAGGEPVLASPKLTDIRLDGTDHAGVFFLDHPVGLPLDPFPIQVLKFGAPGNFDAAYKAKVYGTELEGETSAEGYDGFTVGYSANQAFELVWDILQPGGTNGVPHIERTYVRFSELASDAITQNCELVINTAPLNRLFPGHFPSKAVHIHTSDAPPDESYMMYNAGSFPKWYRASAIQGVFTLEWPILLNAAPTCTPSELGPRHCSVAYKVSGPPPPIVRNIVRKAESKVLTTGRLGAWAKHKLASDAYQDAYRFVSGYAS